MGLIQRKSSHGGEALSGPSVMSCLVAKHCWDPMGLAITDYAYRFERLLDQGSDALP